MSLSISGTVKEVLHEKIKEYDKYTVIIQFMSGSHEKDLAIEVFNPKDKLFDSLQELIEGAEAEFQLNVASRGYNGKWYTTISAWAIKVDQGFQAKTSADFPADLPDFTDDSDELPF